MVAFHIVAHDLFPEERRLWLERLKAANPDDALANYLSAFRHLKEKQVDAGWADLLAAAEKPGFNDYSIEKMQSLEEIYLQSGKSSLEAKVLGFSSVLLPHLQPLADLSKELAVLQQQYLAAGDSASAQSIAEIGWQLGRHLNSGNGSRCLINQLVGVAIERRVLSNLSPETSYEFLGGTVKGRLAQLQTQREGFRNITQNFDRWARSASEADLLTYFERMKLYGENGAMSWLQMRQGF